ncbi:MAG: hypothetical protein R3Y46_04935 [Opitutales bacterium]
MKKRKYSKKNLILFHDGKLWTARVRRPNGSYKFMSSEKMDDSAIPEDMLKWGIENGASAVRVILSRELNDFVLEDPTPHLMPASELYDVLASVIAEKSGQDSEEIAPSLIPDTDLGTQNFGKLWGVGIELQNVSNYNEACRKEGIPFEGVSSLAVLAMLENARNAPAKNLIFFGEKDSFVYASTPSEIVPEYKYIPMACPNSLSNEEFYRRLLRRLQPYLAKPVRLVCPDESIDFAKKIFEETPYANIEFYKFSEMRTEIFQVVADAQTYLLDASEGLVSVAPKKKDAKFTGTVICFAAIILSVLILGGLFGYRTHEVNYWTDMKAKVNAITSAQKSALDEFNNADSKLKEMRSLITSLQRSPSKIDDNFLELINIIAKIVPPTSWIESIEQDKLTGKTIIKGSTLHTKTHSDFVLKLSQELALYKKEAIPRKITINSKAQENSFEIEIAKKQ